jgi:hypothetical protein
MRLVAADLQPFELGSFTAAPSVSSLVPKVRIDLAAATAHAARRTAAIQTTTRTAPAGDACKFTSLVFVCACGRDWQSVFASLHQ